MADFRVLWTEAARLDLERIVEFIAEENPANALTALARVEQRCQTLAALPERAAYLRSSRHDAPGTRIEPAASDGPNAPLAGVLRKHFADLVGESGGYASRRSAIGVVPVWFCCPSNENVKYREPTMTITTPIHSAS